MKPTAFLFFLIIIILTIASGCNSSNQGNERQLQGKIGGQDWEFHYGKAVQLFNENLANITLYEMESSNNPCLIVSSNNGFLTVSIPIQTASYTLPFADQGNTLKFNLPGFNDESFIATSGFMEITSIGSLQVTGYLQAIFDEDNQVEGSFILNVCD